jgi:hypothetical protein
MPFAPKRSAPARTDQQRYKRDDKDQEAKAEDELLAPCGRARNPLVELERTNEVVIVSGQFYRSGPAQLVQAFKVPVRSSDFKYLLAVGPDESPLGKSSEAA